MGTSLAAKAKPDGYTMLSGGSSHNIFTPIIKKVDYSLDDFVPIAIYGKIPYFLAVKSDARWNHLKEFIGEERKFPGTLRVSSFGRLTMADFLIEMLNREANVKLTHVPYKSSGEALTAVLGGHADAAMVSSAGGLLDSGSIKILAIAEEKRLEYFPDIATFKESGLPLVISSHYYLMFPKAVAPEIVEKLYDAQRKAIDKFSGEISQGLKKVEIVPKFMNREETAQQLKREQEIILKMTAELKILTK